MAHVTIPAGAESEVERLWDLQPALAEPVFALRKLVYGKLTISVREQEAARARIATINQCTICMGWRAESSQRHGLTKEFFEHIVDARDRHDIYSTRERLAVEYAERFATDHLNLGTEFFDRLRAHYSDAEILELSLVIARHLAFGRITKVLDLADGCQLNYEGEFDFSGQTANRGAYDFEP